MARFLAQKHLGSLRPTDSSGEDALRKIGNGEVVSIEVKRPRNVKHHRIAKHFLPGVTSEQLRAEVETMTGMRS